MPNQTNIPNNNANTTNGVITPPTVNVPGSTNDPITPAPVVAPPVSPAVVPNQAPKKIINKSPVRRNFYGDHAKTAEQATPGYIDQRNRRDAETLRGQGLTDATDYLKGQKGFLDATPEEQYNTINNVNAMLNSPVPPNGGVVDQGASLQENQQNNQDNPNDTSFIGDMNNGGMVNGQDMKVVPGSSDRYFQGLMTNQQYDTNQQQSPAYKYAQRRSQKLRTIQAQTPQEVATSLVNNKLMRTGQGMRDLMQFDPQRYQLIMDEFDKQNKLHVINSNVTSSNSNNDTVQNTPLQDFDQETNDMIDELYGNDTAMKMKLRDELRNTPSIKAKADKLTELTGKRQKLDEMIFNSEEEARKQLGPEAPESTVQAYASRIGKDLQKQARTLDLDIMNAQAFLQNERDMATQRIADMDHIEQQNMQERQFNRGMYESDRAFGFQMQQFNASQYDKERSRQMEMQEQKAIMLDTIKQARESGQASPYDIEIPEGLIQKSGIGGQCVKYVNDLYERMGMGRPFAGADQSLAAKIKMTQGKLGSPIGVIGGTIVEDFGRISENGTNYGHLSMIIGMDDTGYRVTQSNGLLDSNGKGNGLINQRVIPYNSPSIKGFTVAPSVANSMSQQNGNGWNNSSGDITIDQIISFNDDTTRRKMDSKLVRTIAEAKKKIMSSKDADLSDILAYSNGGKAIGATQGATLTKFDSALSQLGSIQEQISGMKTGPILGALKKLNPYNTDAQVLKAKLSALVPNLARGVYGEVGVLTDADIQQYSKTIPNLSSTEDVNKGVLAMTLDTIAGGYKQQLRSLAGQGYDVSGLEGVYLNIKGQADALRSELGIPSKEQKDKYKDF